MSDFGKIEQFLNDWKGHYEEFQKHSDFLSLEFNLFVLLYDKYKHENFHSNIICELLNYKENGKRIFLELFLEEIGFEHKDVSWEPVTREEGRIDILIKDEKKEFAIIIESKINNASDQYQQIPRYLKDLKSKDFNNIRVVYLTKEGGEPNKESWEYSDIEEININTISVFSNPKQNGNLVKWISNCINIMKKTNVIFTLKNYLGLLNHFFCEYRSQMIVNFFRDEFSKKFYKIHHFKNYERNVWVAKFEHLNSLFPDFKLSVRIECHEDNSLLTINESANKNGTFKKGEDKVGELLEKLNLSNLFTKSSKFEFQHEKKFNFPDEETSLYDTIEKVLDILVKHQTSKPS